VISIFFEADRKRGKLASVSGTIDSKASVYELFHAVPGFVAVAHGGC
jgi:hypothetical protein